MATNESLDYSQSVPFLQDYIKKLETKISMQANSSYDLRSQIKNLKGLNDNLVNENNNLKVTPYSFKKLIIFNQK